jgi:hypothetical protein
MGINAIAQRKLQYFSQMAFEEQGEYIIHVNIYVSFSASTPR